MVAELKEAKFYRKENDRSVLCLLCPHLCHIESGHKGVCNVRENHNGVLYTTTYGRLTSKSIDPVEKKPLYHFYPGSRTYSISSYGCNLHCQYCINWAISQMPNEYSSGAEECGAHAIVAEAKKTHCKSIAYTYVEPTIFYEYIDEVARHANSSDVLNVFKTNGFISAEVLESCSSYMDAANVDLKAFSDTTYRQFGGRLQPILDNLKLMKSLGTWLEITTVIIPDLNDGNAELRNIARFISRELGVDTPWHISRFFPAYKMAAQSPTPLETLVRAHAIGIDEGLRYVYLNNVPLSGYQDTVCPQCTKVVIRRHGFGLQSNKVRENSCPSCRTNIAGVGLTHTP